METCLYQGTVRHRRYAPRAHSFQYKLFMVQLDLDRAAEDLSRIPLWSARRPAPAWFRESDHIAGTPSLAGEIRRRVREHSGQEVTGPVRLLTHLRYFGHVFNPVSFYYCYDQSGRTLEHIVAEVSNTPWNECHYYYMEMRRADPGRRGTFTFAKDFHVSPFMPMEQQYQWSFTAPAASLAVHMENYEQGVKVFDATMTLRRRELTPARGVLTLAGQPAMTARIVAAIYWNALRLWWKKVPFYPHPKKSQPPGTASVHE